MNRTLFSELQCKQYLKIEQSSVENSIDWCRDRYNNTSRFDEIFSTLVNYCDNFGSFECENNVYDYDLLSQSKIESNESIIKIFPSEKPYIKYVYSEKMDFDQLIYQIGGIIGLWFGSSALSLINSLIAVWKRIISKIVGDFFKI